MAESFKSAFQSIAAHTRRNYTGAETALAKPFEHMGLGALASRRMVRGALLAGTAITAAVMPIQFLGLLGSAILLRASYFEQNSERNAAISVGAATYVAHLALLGNAFERMVQVGFLGARTLIMPAVTTLNKRANLGMDDKTLRLVMAGGFFALGAAIMGAHGYTHWMQAMPLLAMGCGVTASAMPDSQSHWARAVSCVPLLPLLMYDVFVSGSWGGVGLEVIGTAVEIAAIRQYDLPRFARDGRKLGLQERLGAYFTSLVRAKHTDEWTWETMRKAGFSAGDIRAMTKDTAPVQPKLIL